MVFVHVGVWLQLSLVVCVAACVVKYSIQIETRHVLIGGLRVGVRTNRPTLVRGLLVQHLCMCATNHSQEQIQRCLCQRHKLVL